MIDEVLNSFGLTLDYLRRLVADVPDEELSRQPAGAVNHPAWIIGHLVYSCQAIGGELGVAVWLPVDWQQTFGTGSVPHADRPAYPSKIELLAALADGQNRLRERLQSMNDNDLKAPLPDERHRAMFPTLGHAVTHILTSHAAVHVGQASLWRKLAGYPSSSAEFV
jgi:hypothetical protein